MSEGTKAHLHTPIAAAFRLPPIHPPGTRVSPLPIQQIRLNTLPAGSQLVQNQWLSSPNGLYRLYMQNDGNLVMYEDDRGRLSPLWASHTNGSGAVRAVMQTDGNFVLYNARNQAVWASNTAGIRSAQYARVTVNDDGTFDVSTPLARNAFRSYVDASLLGRVGAPTIQITNGPPAPTSNTSIYVVVGGAALALGVLGAILYERNRTHL
jgi:hypothetical protein